MKPDHLVNAVVIGLSCAIPTGLVLQFFYPASSWWVMSVGALIIFMAG